MAYRRAKYGLRPIDPEDLADQLPPGTIARTESPSPRREDLRTIKRGAERGWGISDQVKDKAVEVVYEVLEDWNASNRDRLSAVGAVVSMTALDARIDQTSAENPEVTVREASLRAQEIMKRKMAELVTPQATSFPSAVTSNHPATPPPLCDPTLVTQREVGAGGLSYSVELLRQFPTSALALEKAGRIPEGTCASLQITIPDFPEPKPFDPIGDLNRHIKEQLNGNHSR